MRDWKILYEIKMLDFLLQAYLGKNRYTKQLILSVCYRDYLDNCSCDF